MAQCVLRPLHRPVALPSPTRPQPQPPRRPLTRYAAGNGVPACARRRAARSPRPARRQRLDRDARPPQTPRSPDAQRRQCRRRHPRPKQHRQNLRQTPRRQKLRVTQPHRRPRKTRTLLRRSRHAQREPGPRHHPATTAAPPVNPMLPHLPWAGRWKVEQPARNRCARRRCTRQGRPTPPATHRDRTLHTIRARRTPQRLPLAARLAPRLLPQAPRPTPGRRLRKPVARGRLAAAVTVQPKPALQHRYPLDKTRPLLPKHRVPCLQARNPLLQTPRYRHRQRLSLQSAPAHLQVHSCSKHTVNLPTIGNLPGSHVMFCHVPHAQAAYAAAVSGMKLAPQPLPLRLPRDSRAPHRRPSQSRISFLHPVPFRSVLFAAGPFRAAEPCFARNVRVRARAWPRAFRGGARIARLIAPACARAREAGA